MPEQIFILTGEVHSGKTSGLLKWAQKTGDVYGILTPLVDGTRVFMNAHTMEVFDMETTDETGRLEVGKYVFSKAAFEKASKIVEHGIAQDKWLVIDEIGPLELRESGFASVLRKALASGDHLKLVLVIRRSKLDECFAHFAIDKFSYNIIQDTNQIR